ncbi:MAG: multiheme c-type cytochrome [Nitrospinales bacterium]
MTKVSKNIILKNIIIFLCLALAYSSPVAQEYFDFSSESSSSNEGFENDKEIVKTPDSVEKEFEDAEDFRDPFFLMRGYREDSKYLLVPGTTIDGIRFNSYADSNTFIENYYRDSNFALEDVFGRITPDESKVECLHCHNGIEQISVNHKFSCQKCHLGNPRTRQLPKAHKGMVSNPSTMEHAPRFCGKCHAQHIEKVKNSLMGTANGIRNATRYAWGEKSDDSESLSEDFLQKKCLRCHVQSPSPRRAGDYRAEGCAACHMIYANDGNSLSRDRAIQRAQKVEMTLKPDRFSQKFANNSLFNKRGFPVLHKFTVAIPSVQCEHCHNNNGIGNEFEGLMGKPSRPQPHRLKIDAKKPLLYGREHEFLLPDIHREKNMHCVDCHGGEEIKGGASAKTMHDVVKVRCESCHGTHENAPAGKILTESDPKEKLLLKNNDLNPNLKGKIKVGDTIMVNSDGELFPHIKKEKEGWVLISKVTGDKHILPVLKNSSVPLGHSIKKHMATIECHACHARWSANEWGLHATKEQDLDINNWRNWSFSDPILQHILARPQEKWSLGMLDWSTAKTGPNDIQGKWKPGVWLNIFTETDWSTLILGKNERGKYSIFKPQHQYFITDNSDPSILNNNKTKISIASDGKPGLVMAPHTPHTIRRITRPCESCHGNSLAAGLGDTKKHTIQNAKQFLENADSQGLASSKFYIKQMQTESGEKIQTPLPYTKTRFLNSGEIKSLKHKTDRYKAYRYLDLRGKNFPRLLAREDFPYDDAHVANEEKFGSPEKDEELFYGDDQNRFTGNQKPENLDIEPTPKVVTIEPYDDSMTIDEHSSPILEFSKDLSKKQSTENKIPEVITPDKITGFEKLPEVLPVKKIPIEENSTVGADKPKSATQLLDKFINKHKETSEVDQPTATSKDP